MQCGSADLRVCAGHAGKSIHFRKNTLECLGNSHFMVNMSVTGSQKVLKRLMIMNVWVSVRVCVCMCVCVCVCVYRGGGEEEEERKQTWENVGN